MRTINSLILAGGLLACGTTFGGDLLQWQNNSLTYLWGKNFKVNPAIQQTVTFEHADGWKYGDNFIFVDKIFYQARKMPATARTPITVRSAHACRSTRSSTRRSSSARSRMCCWR